MTISSARPVANQPALYGALGTAWGTVCFALYDRSQPHLQRPVRTREWAIAPHDGRQGPHPRRIRVRLRYTERRRRDPYLQPTVD